MNPLPPGRRTPPSPVPRFLAATLPAPLAATLLATPLGAMQIRNASPERHNRFLNYPEAPNWNPNAWFTANQFTGIGWSPSDSPFQRQFALATPSHLLAATHFLPAQGTTIRFLNLQGNVITRTVASSTPVKNPLNQATDLSLVTLSSPLLPTDAVLPFPYLNLPEESAYPGTPLVVFGWHARAGAATIASIGNLSEPGINLTRALRFDFPKEEGSPDDCWLEVGDSGSPSFALVNGLPAITGIHSAADEDALFRYGYDTFVPHYAAQLNTLLETSGYAMTPASPPETPLIPASSPIPPNLRQAQPGQWRFTLTNTSAHTATNLVLALAFPPAYPPDAVEAPGWITQDTQPGIWTLRRGTLPTEESTHLTASWNALPTIPQLTATLTHAADGQPALNTPLSQALTPSYTAWAANLTDPAPAADPDGDGISNLLEYAFGGDPNTPSHTRPSGQPLLPTLTPHDGEFHLAFFVRSDASIRGLNYPPQFSTTLESNDWSTEHPPGTAVLDAPSNPANPDWLLRTLVIPQSQPTLFVRIRVHLDES